MALTTLDAACEGEDPEPGLQPAGQWGFIPGLCLAISQITLDKLFDNFQIKS